MSIGDVALAVVRNEDHATAFGLDVGDVGDVPDEQAPAACGLADVAVFPFTRVENSGSVIAALATGVRVVAPRLGALVELAAESSLQLYDGELTGETIRQSLVAQTTERVPSAPAERSIQAVVRGHLAVYALAEFSSAS